jgi:hydroxymethylbilane synthase
MAQTNIAAERLKQIDPSLDVEIQTISTTGDRDQRVSLSEIGGKGVFIRELEGALQRGEIDIAVHSFKDITSQVQTGLELCGFFHPESVCDVLVSRNNLPLLQLPAGATIGTGSLRRRALLIRLRPDLQFVDIRGNIDTRISKLDQGLYDGIVLSEAGLIRLGLETRIAQRFDPLTFFPAPGQGVIAFEIRTQDERIRQLCKKAGDDRQQIITLAELSLLDRLGFDCRTPLGVYTQMAGDILSMDGFFVNPLTGKYVEQHISGLVSNPQELGFNMSYKLLEGGN